MIDYNDVILPEGFEEPETTTPQVAETEVDDITDTTAENQTEVVEGEESTEQVQEQTSQPFLKVKYNHEERNLTMEEAQALAQKGMNYDKVYEKLQELESDPSLAFVEAQANRHGMTVDQYLEAVKEQEEQEKLNELIQKNIPEELAKEILENRKFRDEYDKKDKEKKAQEKEQAEFSEFLQSFPDVKSEDIPEEVWEMRDNGMSLKYAYMQYENNMLKNKIKITQQNESNKAKAPVNGVTGHGTENLEEDDPFLKGFNSI